jgi:hypothetical protein
VTLNIYLHHALSPKTDPALYEELIAPRLNSDPSHYSFLPAKIPPAAMRVGFHHVPHFLQGGYILTLRLEMSPESINHIAMEIQSTGSTSSTNLPNEFTCYAYPPFSTAKRRTKGLFDGLSPLPADFQIYPFQTDLADLEKNWNHNFVGYTAVSTQRNEVVYYVNDW